MTNLFVDRPVVWLVLVSLQIALITGITIVFDWFKSSPTSNRDYLIWDDPKTINYDKTTLAQSRLSSGVGSKGDSSIPLQVSIDRDWVMFLIYSEQVVNEIATTSTLSGEDAYEGNMWTRSSLIAIRDLEAPVRGSPEFGQYCWSDSTIVAPVSPKAESNPTFSDVVCHKGSFLSPLYLLYFSGYLPNDLETITQDELDEALKKTIEDENAWANFKNLFDKEVTADNLKVRYLRT
jgi:hypothetical protein